MTIRRAHEKRSVVRDLLALFITSAVLLAAGHGAAEESWAYDLAGELMSPYCPGRTVSSCPSPQAAELVQWILLQEAAGSTREEVIEVLIERFGEEILGAPPARGITLWAYVFPVLGFVVGGGLAFLALRRIVATGSGSAEPTPPASPLDVSSPGKGGAIGSASSEDDLASLVDRDLAARG